MEINEKFIYLFTKERIHLEVLVLSSKRSTILSLSKDSLSTYYVPSTVRMLEMEW